MTITQHGMICDVGGEYILLADHQQFELTGNPTSGRGDTCLPHKEILIEACDKNDWEMLPDGPVRRGFEGMEKAK